MSTLIESPSASPALRPASPADAGHSPGTTPSATAQAAVATVGLALTIAISIAAWRSPLAIMGVLMLPIIMNMLRFRAWPFLVALAYFGAGNAEIPAITERFFAGASLAGELAAAVGLTLLQSLPFWLYRPDATPARRSAQMMAVLVLLAIPPLGMVAWRNPLFVAGLFYPGLGLAGVALALAAFGGLAGGGISFKAGRRIPAVLTGVAVAGAVVAMATAKAPPLLFTWQAANTQIEPTRTDGPIRILETIPGDRVAAAIEPLLSPATDVIVLPESVLAPLTPADQVAMMPAVERARRLGITVLVGTVVQVGHDRWRNTVAAYGAMQGTVDESRLPMPVGNWRPGTGTGVAARPFASDLVTIQTRSGPRVAAMSICFEDIVLWPHFGLLTGRADVLVSMGNAWSYTGTRTLTAQTTSAQLLARLAGVHLVRATNTSGAGRG